MVKMSNFHNSHTIILRHKLEHDDCLNEAY